MNNMSFGHVSVLYCAKLSVIKSSEQRALRSQRGHGAKVYVPRTSGRVRTRKVSKTERARGWKDEHRACRIDFSPQSGLQTPTSSLGWSFWSLGWEGKDAFGRVLFDSGGSLPLIPPSAHTHMHANSSVLTFRLIHCTNSSRRPRDRYPSIPPSIHL